MDFEFDFKEFEDYAKKFEAMQKEFDTWLKQFLLQQAQRLIGHAKLRTPVDTGALRACYGIGSQRLILKESDNLNSDGSTSIVLDEVKSSIATIDMVGDNFTVMVWNGMEYASFVEFGHHSYPPQYMLTISTEYVVRAMPNRFKKQYKEYLKGWGLV